MGLPLIVLCLGTFRELLHAVTVHTLARMSQSRLDANSFVDLASLTVQKKRGFGIRSIHFVPANLLRQAISRGRNIFTTQKLDHVPESDSDSDKSLCRWKNYAL